MTIKKIKTPKGEIKWLVDVYTNGRSGQRTRKRFDRRVDAQMFLKKTQDEILHRMLNMNPDAKALNEVLFEEEINHWLAMNKANFTEGYLRAIRPALKRVEKFCRKKTLDKINSALLMSFRNTLFKDGLRPSTQNRYCDLILRVMNFSYSQGRISVNPIKGYKKLKEPKDGFKYWEENEIKKFLSFADEKYPKRSTQRWKFVAYLFALETGVRARELWGIQVINLNLERNIVEVNQQLAADMSFALTKGKNRRLVPISNVLKSELRDLTKDLENSETVFKNSVGLPVDHDNFVPRVYLKDIKESSLRRIKFHELRHSALTLMAKRGTSPWLLKSIAGHKDLSTTLRYVHIAGNDIEKLGENIRLFD